MGNKGNLRTMLKEAGILFVITLVSGLLLGTVYELTKEPIRLQQEKAIQEACKAVFQEAETFVLTEYTLEEELAGELTADGVKAGDVYLALGADGSLLGYVLESVSTKGYGGNIVIYMGVTLEGTLNDISILEIAETAGLGMEAPKVLAPQFHDKQVESFVYTKTGAQAEEEIDAIASATITTQAVTDAVNGGLKVARALAEGGVGNE